MAFITAKVWLAMKKADTKGIFYDLLSRHDKNEDNTLDTFVRWFTKIAYQACVKNYRNIRSTRGKSIWSSTVHQQRAAREQRSRSRKRKVSGTPQFEMFICPVPLNHQFLKPSCLSYSNSYPI